MENVRSNPEKKKTAQVVTFVCLILVPILLAVHFLEPAVPWWLALVPLLPAFIAWQISIAIGKIIRRGNFYGTLTLNYMWKMLRTPSRRSRH